MAEEDRTVREEGVTVRDTDGPTVREMGNAETRGTTTVRESDARSSQAVGWLPTAIAVNHKIIKALPARGGEADIYLVGAFDTADATTKRVAKVYRQGIEPKEEVLRRVRDADPHYVVRIEDYSQDAVTGRWWELMEHVEHDNLGMLMEREGPTLSADVVMVILQELNDALGELHELDLEHRDLKPGNVLVRSRDPLNLVLADFGISSVMSATIHFTNAARTMRYAPPEATSGVIERATWDYWSLGMMLVEMLTGEHPFADLSDSMIAYQLATLNTEDLVERVSDTDWRKLCRGLLRRTPSVRWDNDAVSKWIANPKDRSLEVAEDAFGTGTPSTTTTTTIDFDGTSFSTPADLGAALAKDWDKAASFWKRRFGDVRTWLTDSLGLHELGDAAASIDDNETPLDTQVFCFVYLLAPNAPLRYRDQEISLHALSELAQRATRWDPVASETLQTLYRERIPSLAGALPGAGELGRLSARWDEAVSDYENTREALAREGVTVPGPTGEQLTLLLAASTPGNIEGVAMLRERARRARTHTCTALFSRWFRDFGEPEDMSEAVLVLTPLVQAAAVEQVLERHLDYQRAFQRADKIRHMQRQEQERERERVREEQVRGYVREKINGFSELLVKNKTPVLFCIFSVLFWQKAFGQFMISGISGDLDELGIGEFVYKYSIGIGAHLLWDDSIKAFSPVWIILLLIAIVTGCVAIPLVLGLFFGTVVLALLAVIISLFF